MSRCRSYRRNQAESVLLRPGRRPTRVALSILLTMSVSLSASGQPSDPRSLAANQVAATSDTAADVGIDLQVEALWRQGEFEQAIRLCQKRLRAYESKDDPLAEIAEQLTWSRWLLQSYTRLALTRENSASTVWGEQETAYGRSKNLFSGHDEELALDLEYLHSQWIRGRAERLQAEMTADADRLGQARTTLREIVRQCGRLMDRITVRQRSGRRTSPTASPRGPTPVDLHALALRARFQLAEAYREQALCYEEGSPDRVHALTQAAQHYDALAGRASKSPLAVRSQLGAANSYRLLRDLNKAQSILASTGPAVAKLPADDPARTEFVAEQAELLLASGRIEQAVRLLANSSDQEQPGPADEQHRRDDWLSGRLAYLRIAALAQLSESRTVDAATRRRAGQQALDALERLEKKSERAYWTRRAQAALSQRRPGRAGQSDPALLQRAAESLYRRGHLSQAYETYKQAANAAESAGRHRQAFVLYYRAALVLGKMQRSLDAANELASLAGRLAQDPRAAKVHLMAVRIVAQSLAGNNAETAAGPHTESSIGQLYGRLIEEHLQKWPDAATCDIVRRYQARWLLAQGETDSALRKLMEIRYRDEEGIALVRLLESLCTQAADSHAGGEGSDDTGRSALTDQLVQLAERWLEDASNGEESAANSAVVSLLLQIGRLRWLLLDQWDESQHVQRRLAAVAEEGESRALPMTNEYATIQALLALRSLVQANCQQGNHYLRRLDDVHIRYAGELTDALDRWLQQADQSQQARPFAGECAALLLRLTDLLDPQSAGRKPTFQSVVTWSRVRAYALARTGNVDRGREVLENLVTGNPDALPATIALARYLSAFGTAKDMSRAIASWRRVASLTQEGTVLWYEAKYQLASAHLRMGDAERTVQMIRLLQAVHPDLGGRSLRMKFQRLLMQARKRSGGDAERSP